MHIDDLPYLYSKSIYMIYLLEMKVLRNHLIHRESNFMWELITHEITFHKKLNCLENKCFFLNLPKNIKSYFIDIQKIILL